MSLMMPKFIEEGYHYRDELGMIRVKPDAPEWAKKDYEEYIKKLHPVPDENGLIIQY